MLSSPTTESLKIVRIIESIITYSDIELLSLLKKNYNLQLERICNHPDGFLKDIGTMENISLILLPMMI